MNEASLLRRGAIILTLLALVGCGGRSSTQLQTPGQKNAGNFSKTVFVGDSLTAGFQSGSLLDSQQVHGWAPLVAQQANFTITLPLIAFPGAPNVLRLISLNPPATAPAPGQTTGRDDFTAQPTDLAVPGHTLKDALSTGPVLVPTTGQQQITQLVLGYPQFGFGTARSQVDEAIALQPTTIFVWIGNNDALVADFTGMPASMTSTADFTTQYALLTTKLASTGANLVFLNIPDVTAVPYLTPAAIVLAQVSAQTGEPVAVLSHILGIQAGDYVNPTGLAEIPVILNAVLSGHAAGPIDDAGFLSAAEVTTAQATVQAYNATIAAQASSVGATVVDINALFAQVKANGVTINGFPATANYLGGLFSLDGIHPTNTAYALVANKVIDTLNTSIHTSITDANVSAIAATDPLFTPNLAVGAATIPVSAAQGVTVLFKK
jgi:lysophospholipase L1-like esterase